MARSIRIIGHDDPTALRGHQHKIRMRHSQPLAAVGADLIRNERQGPIEFANGFNEHAMKVELNEPMRKVASPT